MDVKGDQIDVTVLVGGMLVRLQCDWIQRRTRNKNRKTTAIGESGNYEHEMKDELVPSPNPAMRLAPQKYFRPADGNCPGNT